MKISVLVMAPVLLCASLSVSQQALAQPQPSPQTGISLKDFIARVRVDNRSILGKRAEKELAQTGIDRANAAFTPMFSFSALSSYSNQRNTPEESLTRDREDNYERRGQDYTAAISRLLPTGAKVEFKTSLSRFMTNVSRALDGSESDKFYNRSNYGVSLTQPLLKDAGLEVNAAKQRVAELDALAAEHGDRETETSVVAEAAMAYYDLVFAQERVRFASERVEAGSRLLDQAKNLVQAGRLPQADVWEVENSLGRYRAALSEARQIQLDRSNRLRNFLTIGPRDADSPRLLAIDKLPEQLSPSKSFAESLGAARANRVDLLMRQTMVERESVQYGFSANQLKPRLDLVANYGRNGLSFSSRESFSGTNTQDYPNWTVGVQFSIPIGKNMQGLADIKAAAVRRSDAMLALKALEMAIGNDIETTLNLRDSATERLSLLQEVAARERQYLTLERLRLEAGRSDMREILVREERAINARLAVEEQRLAAVKADLMLQAAQGILLNHFE